MKTIAAALIVAASIAAHAVVTMQPDQPNPVPVEIVSEPCSGSDCNLLPMPE
jgi:hypothetical protein